MIKKSGYLLLGVLAYGIIESLFLGYSYYIAFSVILFFVVSSDILLFNHGVGTNILDVSVERSVPGNFSRKREVIDVELRFINKGKKTVYFHYFDTLSDAFRSSGDYEGFLVLGPGEDAKKTYSLTSTVIGKYNIGPVKIYTQDAMKLCISEFVLPQVDEVKVAPSLTDIHTQRSERLSNFIFYTGIHYSRKVGQGYDFYNVRQYYEGDDLRYVAWNRFGITTGDDLYIKQMEEEKPTDVIFVIDYSLDANHGAADARLYDAVVNSVLNVAHTVIKNHDGVGFMLESSVHDYFISPGKTLDPINKFEKIVSEIRPEGNFEIAQIMKKIKDNVKKNALIFLITPFSYPESFGSTNISDFKIGKKVVVFLIDPSFLYPRTNEDALNKLLISTQIKEHNYLSKVSNFFNSIGFKSSVSSSDKLLSRLMYEYKYGKMTNEGY